MKKQPELYQKIWQVVNQIPEGKVATYGLIARLAGLGAHARLVGYALHNLPHHSTVPWHRVVNSRGKISLSRDSGYYEIQKALLKQEHIIFDGDKINLDKYGWRPEKLFSTSIDNKLREFSR